MSAIEERVKRRIAEQISIDAEQVSRDQHLVNDLNFDSLDTMELVLAVEEEFGMEIVDEDAFKFQTVADVVDFVAGKVPA